MRLPYLCVEGFRSFRDETKLELAPLTLLYGHNQAGKSSILRLLPLLASSIHSDVQILNLRSDALMGSTFKELGWLGRNPKKPKITVGLDDSSYRISLEEEDGTLVANHLRIRYGKGKEQVWGARYARGVEGNRKSIQAVSDSGESYTLLFPNFFVSSEELPKEVAEVVNGLKESTSPLVRLQWLHADRVPEGKARMADILCCPYDGSDLARILQNQPTVIASVSKWLSRPEVLGETFHLQSNSRGESIFELRREGHEARLIHLAGEGVRSLLPIILCAAWAEAKKTDSPTMLAIEEPESHLHPKLQIELAKRLFQTAKLGIPVVLETHSVYLLRAMQLAILQGELKREQIRLYWVEQSDDGAARLKPIPIRDDATLENWQPKTFEEEQELSREILLKRWERLKEERA